MKKKKMENQGKILNRKTSKYQKTHRTFQKREKEQKRTFQNIPETQIGTDQTPSNINKISNIKTLIILNTKRLKRLPNTKTKNVTSTLTTTTTTTSTTNTETNKMGLHGKDVQDQIQNSNENHSNGNTRCRLSMDTTKGNTTQRELHTHNRL